MRCGEARLCSADSVARRRSHEGIRAFISHPWRTTPAAHLQHTFIYFQYMDWTALASGWIYLLFCLQSAFSLSVPLLSVLFSSVELQSLSFQGTICIAMWDGAFQPFCILHFSNVLHESLSRLHLLSFWYGSENERNDFMALLWPLRALAATLRKCTRCTLSCRRTVDT
jgi:hypothetical protein